jgi:hypothetical protein
MAKKRVFPDECCGEDDLKDLFSGEGSPSPLAGETFGQGSEIKW